MILLAMTDIRAIVTAIRLIMKMEMRMSIVVGRAGGNLCSVIVLQYDDSISGCHPRLVWLHQPVLIPTQV